MPKLLAILALTLLAGCTVGPQYTRPDATLPARFDQAADLRGDEVPRQLWSSFKDADLDRLITRALQANTSVAQAAARLDETRALAGLTVYSLFPTVTGVADAERSQPSGRDPFLPSEQGRTDTYRAGFDALWEIDLFGSLRNQSKQIRARLEADDAALADVRISIVAEVAQTWFALLGARQQLALGKQQLANLDGNVDLLQRLLDAGRGNALDLNRSITQARSLAAQLPQAEAEVVRQEQRLAALTGWNVATLRAELRDGDELPELPALVTVGTPQDWLLRRPDVRAAERRLAAAYAEIGYQTAQYFPILTLLGDFGWTAQSIGGLGGDAAQRWSFGPSLSWRFLDFGRVRRQVMAAEARADGAEAAWQETVLRALEETENALAGLRASNQSAVELDAALVAAQEGRRLSQLRFDAGASTWLDVLDAERSLLELQSQNVTARVRQATALAAVYKALAGDFATAE